jgi:ribulose-phosphate 3-epimerase
MSKIIISPSILSADFADFGSAVKEIEDSNAPWLHMDIMDGCFVPNITFGPPLVRSLRRRSGLFFDVHLMVKEPGRFINDFAGAGADGITFHYEAEVHSQKLLADIHKHGKMAGISIVPSTPVLILEELLPYLDLVLIMTVNPGFGGQKIIPEALEKIKKLIKMRENMKLDFKISVDGGIDETNWARAVALGADILVIGSAFFSSSDKKGLISKIVLQS